MAEGAMGGSEPTSLADSADLGGDAMASPAGEVTRHFLRDDDLSPAEQAEVLSRQDAAIAWLLARSQ